MRVERVEIVSAFRRDPSVVLEKGPQIKALATRLRGRIINVKTPSNAPPELPRFVLQIERGVLQVGLNRFQLVVQPPKHIDGSYSESLAYAASLATPAFEALYHNGHPTFSWSGVVVVLNYPATSASISSIDAIRPLLARITTLGWPADELASFGLRVGRRHHGFYRNYGLAGYDIRQLEVKMPTGKRSVEVNLEGGDVSESGVSVTVDVNSQPSKDSYGPLEDLQQVLGEHAAAFGSMIPDLNLRGLL